MVVLFGDHLGHQIDYSIGLSSAKIGLERGLPSVVPRTYPIFSCPCGMSPHISGLRLVEEFCVFVDISAVSWLSQCPQRSDEFSSRLQHLHCRPRYCRPASPSSPLLSNKNIAFYWIFQSKRMDFLSFINNFWCKDLTWMQSIMSPVSRQRDHLDCEAPQEAEQGLHSDHSTSTWPEPSSSPTSSSSSSSSSPPLPSPLPEVRDFQFQDESMNVILCVGKAWAYFHFKVVTSSKSCKTKL